MISLLVCIPGNWSEILVHTQNIMKFLRKRACTLACSPLRIVLSLLMGWAAMWVFIWCYIWTVATTLATWFALQSLHYIFSAAATVRLWSTLSTWWSTMRDSRTAGGGRPPINLKAVKQTTSKCSTLQSNIVCVHVVYTINVFK